VLQYVRALEGLFAHGFASSLRNGLRDTPSFVVNIMSQWANILIYFQMPSWIKDWNNIVEEEGDPDDVKALKVNPKALRVCLFLCNYIPANTLVHSL